MQSRYQDDVKVAVYAEPMTAAEPITVYEVMGAMCIGCGLLLAFWLA